MRSLLEAAFPEGKNRSYRLNENDSLIFRPGDNTGTFEVQFTGYCSYGVQLSTQYDWADFGTLILLEKVNVGDVQDVTYDGNEHKLAPTVTGAKGRALSQQGTFPDYELKYYRGDVETTDFTSPGEIKVVVNFKSRFAYEQYYPSVTKTYTIQKKEGMTVDTSRCGYTGVYDGVDHFGSAAVVSVPDGTKADATIKYSIDGENWSSSLPQIKNVGKATVQVRVTHPYYKDATGSYTLEVTQAKATVAANSASKTYGQADPIFTAEVKGLVNDEPQSLIQYTVSRSNTDENADTYERVIVPTGETSQGNYVVEYVTADFTINQAEVTVTADDSSKVYGDEDPVFTAKVEGLVNGESESLINYAVSRTNIDEIAGTYEDAIAPKGEASQGNYSVTFVPADFTISKRAIEVNDSATFEYSGQEQALNIDAAKAVGLADGDKLYLDNAQVRGTEPGTYTDVTEYTWKAAKGELDVTGSYDLKVSGELIITAASSNDSDVDDSNAGSDDGDSSGSADEGEASSETPQTGDSSASFAVGVGMVAIAAALTAFFVSRRLRSTARR